MGSSKTGSLDKFAKFSPAAAFGSGKVKLPETGLIGMMQQNKEDKMNKYKSIQIPITEEDIQMFQELIEGHREPFMWTFDKVNVEFIKEEEEE